MYRPSKCSAVTKTLKIATINMQGMNFLNIHARDKVAGLIEAARKGKWQLAAISDVAGGSDKHVCCYAIEEFLFVVWGKVAILMSPELSQCWRDHGAIVKRMQDSGNETLDGFSHRLLTVVFKTGGTQYAFHAVYAPTGNREHHRKIFFTDLEVYTNKWRSQCKNVYEGDWNSHIGKGHDSPRCGQHMLPQQTSSHSQRMLNWMGETGLWHNDSFVPVRHRGTWQLVMNSRWYELDYFVSDITPNQPSSRRWQKMSTICVPLTDHHGKVVTLQLHGRRRQRSKSESRNMGHSVFDGTLIKPRLRTDKMRGPSDSATSKRDENQDW